MKNWWLPLLLALIVLPFLGGIGAITVGVGSLVMIFLSNRQRPDILEKSKVREASQNAFVAKVDVLIAKKWVQISAFLVIITLPFYLPRFPLEIVTLALIYVLLAMGLDIVVGLTGLLALGFIAFYAVGAYTYALLSTKLELNFFLAIPVGAVVAAIVGFLVGLPVLRLKGDYLAIVTLGFGEITRIVLNNWDRATGGPNGIGEIPRPTLFGLKLASPAWYYWIILLMVFAGALIIWRLVRSKIGRSWEAIREDELAAAACGIPVVKYKLFAFSLGASYAGGAGVFFAGRMTHISPESFTFLESIMVLCMVVLGGMGSLAGVVVGALALIILPELLRGAELYRMLAFGILLILMMRFRPQGILPARRAQRFS